MTRTGVPAMQYTYARVGDLMPDDGLCLQFTRQDFDVPSLYYSAIDAWNANQHRHEGDRNPPPAVPIWFWSPSPYRHVCFHLAANYIVSTYNDEIRIYGTLEDVENAFGGPYMGWSESINDVYVFEDVHAPTNPQEDDMQVLFTTGKDPQVWIGDGISRRKVVTQDTLAAMQWLTNAGLLNIYANGAIQTIADPWSMGHPIDA